MKIVTKLLIPILFGAALVGSQAALAAPTAKATTAAKTTVATTTKPAAAATPKTTVAKSTAKTVKATGGRMVTTKTSTGKTITYDCSKPGNASKKVCK